MLPRPASLAVERIQFTPQGVVIELASRLSGADCPSCGQHSSRIHSHYVRKLRDLPAHGRSIQLRVRLRRFFCDFRDCPRHTFAERMPEVATRYSRRTCRLASAFQHIGLVTGGEAGARLANELSMPVSADTLLRLTRQTMAATLNCANEIHQGPRVLGVDDWAFHRGQSYGTILCDLELRQPVDLLPERSAESFAAWLQAHAGVQIISRDRGIEYAKGATSGAPQAIQVADRFHLRKNLTDALIEAIDRRHSLLAEAAKTLRQKPMARVASPQIPTESGVIQSTPSVSPPTKLTRRQQQREEHRSKRLTRYQQIKQLQATGTTLREIAKQMGLSRCTVRHMARAMTFPEYADRRKRRGPLDKYEDHLRQRWREGCRSAAELYRDLKQQGFSGSMHMVRRRVAAWREPQDAMHVTGQRPAARPVHHWRPSARSVAWLLLKPPEQPTVDQAVFLATLHESWPELAENVMLVQEFGQVLRAGDAADLDAWMELVNESTIFAEIKRFAAGLRQDWQAVVEAVRQRWSNGQVEGQINRLKLIKRLMYGRANFDLLRTRVLHAN
jgi:transposase